MKSKPLYTFLSIIVLSLSIGLLLGIKQLKKSFKFQMGNNLGNIDLVVGAKGSPLQLVLASVLHIDNPTGNISYNEAMKISKTSMIKTAVPISYGDNYKGFKIIGTTHEFINVYEAKLEKGRTVKKAMEVVLGYTVAENLNLTIGDTFLSSHGLVENNIDVHQEKLTVVGILKPTQKVIDRLIITDLESIWDVHDHKEEDSHHDEHEDHDTHIEEHDKEEDSHHDEHEDHDSHIEEHDEEEGNHHDEHEDHNNHIEDHREEKEITSLLITFRSPTAFLTLPRKINKHTNMQAVLPKFELNRLYEYTGVGFKTISWIAYLILIISCISIFISLYKMVKERSFDLALLRTYGASNFQLIQMVAYEGLLIVCIALLLGYTITKVGLHFMFKIIEEGYKQNILQELSVQELLQTGFLIVTMVILSVLLAMYPIIKMNISTILSNEK